MAHQVHAALAPVDEYDASAARASHSPFVDGPIVKVVHAPQVQVVEKTIEFPQLQTVEKIVDTPEIQTVQSTESLDTAPDLGMAPAERTLRIALADCEGVIEELSKAMEEGLSAVLDEFIENFDKPEGLPARIDEHFEKRSQTRSMRAMNTYAVRGPRRKVSPAFSGTATRIGSPSRNLWMTRDACTVGWTDTVTVGKRGWLSTTWMRNPGTHPFVERSPNMWGD